LRQLEQGSHATLYVAECPDGILARQIETIFRRQGIADKIKLSQKKDILLPDLPQEEIEKELNNFFSPLVASLQEYEILQKCLLSKPKFKCWENDYNLPAVKKVNKFFNVLKLSSDESASGVVIAIKGAFVFIETDSEIAAICAKDLLGCDLDFSPLPYGTNVKGGTQTTLF
jgi:hypothetical protein